ncbi:hypothetical protein K2173_000272 [Erythroxylum novogranatense]|uniref:Uncharacterized protein n=1 Tax=Erythroxylum novogranatense TaxID=1862640 RepID=A0AAV8SWQ3_9ROSI|nr:hypothetical protein K2173_000272 [Erythroxylum novogranatense]
MRANREKKSPSMAFSTPPATWRSPYSHAVTMPMSERKRVSPGCKRDLFHVVYKVPAGDSPYVRAKHVQLIEKDPSKAISLFWAAINAGDRVDSALKDMAVVMKQLDRADEAIEAIKSFRHLCPYDSQESIDNVLIELYKRSGRIEEEIEILQQKLKDIEEGVAFGGKRTKTARSQGKKIQITVEQEQARILGNLAWAYLQHHNYGLAEQHYRKALSLEPDKNKQCNLAICLMHMNRFQEAKSLLQLVKVSCGNKGMDESYAKSYERASKMLDDLELTLELNSVEHDADNKNSLPLPISRKLKEDTNSNSESQHFVCGYLNSRRQNPEGPHVEKEDKTFECNEENSEHKPPGSRSCFASPQAAIGCKWMTCSYFQCPGERSDFTKSKRSGDSTTLTGTDLTSAHKMFPSPAPVLYTQPKRWHDERRIKWRVDRVELPAENELIHTVKNLNSELRDSTEGQSEPTLRKSQSSLVSPSNEEWRRTSRKNEVDSWKNMSASEPEVRDQTMRRWPDSHRTTWNWSVYEDGGHMEPRMELSRINAKFPLEEVIVAENALLSESSTEGQKDQISGGTVCRNINATESAEDQSKERKHFSKRWADLVEEEEDILLHGEDDFDDWVYGDELSVENLKPNIAVGSICRKLGAFDLKDGSGTSDNAVWTRDSTVRRSLRFKGEKDTNMKRKNRLQVFRDITPTPDCS